MIRVKVIDIQKEGVTAQMIEDLLNSFIVIEKPDNIIHVEFNTDYGFLIIIYEK
jgi:hypothetical protein